MHFPVSRTGSGISEYPTANGGDYFMLLERAFFVGHNTSRLPSSIRYSRTIYREERPLRRRRSDVNELKYLEQEC